jgi:4-carboxymuconolactone decarboxylase
VKPEVVDAIASGKRPTGMTADQTIAYNFIDELLTTHQVSDAAFKAVKDRWGDKGVVDITGLSGWYCTVSMALNTDRYPLAEGQKPELKPLENPLPMAGMGFATPPPGPFSPKTTTVTVNGKTMSLRGDRLAPPTWEQTTPEQKKFLEMAAAGRGTAGSFNISLHSPEAGEIFYAMGERVRFHMSVPDKLKELAILIAARYWGAQYEWTAHHRAGVQAGLTEEKVKAIAEGRRPAGMSPDEDTVYTFISDLFKTHQVTDATFDSVKKLVGERGLVDLMMSAAYYQMVSMFMNVDRLPVNEGQQPELKYIAKPIS